MPDKIKMRNIKNSKRVAILILYRYMCAFFRVILLLKSIHFFKTIRLIYTQSHPFRGLKPIFRPLTIHSNFYVPSS